MYNLKTLFNREIRVCQVADDTTLFVANEDSITKALDIVFNFSDVAGPKLNKRKTERLWVGKWKKRWKKKHQLVD